MKNYKCKIYTLVIAEEHPNIASNCVTYKVSIGYEENKIVQKIQMMYDGKIQNKEDLSFYTNDNTKVNLNKELNKIISAMNLVINNFYSINETVRKQMSETNITEYDVMQKINKRIRNNKKALPKFQIESLKDNYISETLPIRRTVLEIVKQYNLRKKMSSDELKEIFNYPDLPTKSLDIIMTISEFKEWRETKKDKDPRYFINPDDIIKTQTDDCVVCTQWTQKNFNRFMSKFNKDNNILKISRVI